jgi:small-conductance mechanosensitive channel
MNVMSEEHNNGMAPVKHPRLFLLGLACLLSLFAFGCLWLWAAIGRFVNPNQFGGGDPGFVAGLTFLPLIGLVLFLMICAVWFAMYAFSPSKEFVGKDFLEICENAAKKFGDSGEENGGGPKTQVPALEESGSDEAYKGNDSLWLRWVKYVLLNVILFAFGCLSLFLLIFAFIAFLFAGLSMFGVQSPDPKELLVGVLATVPLLSGLATSFFLAYAFHVAFMPGGEETRQEMRKKGLFGNPAPEEDHA